MITIDGNQKSKINSPDKSEHYSWGNNCEGWHLVKSDSLSVIREKMPAGASEILHYHEQSQQFFYLLTGSASFEIDGNIISISESESLQISPGSLHRIFNNKDVDLEFLLISQPNAQNDRIDIIDYDETLSEPIKKLNYEWLEKYFRVEPGDVISLSNPKKEIIDKGGFIFYAQWKNEIVGTASLLKVTDELFELGKMAVTEKAQGHHIGNILLEHCFHFAKNKQIKKIALYSNTKLSPAIHLYKKYGFVEVALEHGRFERANIKMEKVL